MDIKATEVAKLRKMTGAGMMDCKKALIEAQGDYERAQEIIREKGKLIAAKRADRLTTEGAVIALANEERNKAVLVSLGCETDFVATNAAFKELANKIAKAALDAFPDDMAALLALTIDGVTIQEAVTQQSAKSGEKHVVAFYNKIEAPYIATYIHNNYKVASIVGFNKPVSAELGKDIAMQVTAMNPVAINRDNCPQKIIDKEMLIYREQIRLEGKPEALVEKIAFGKLNKFFKEYTLEDQIYVKDGKISVKDHIKSIDPQAKVVAFYRFALND